MELDLKNYHSNDLLPSEYNEAHLHIKKMCEDSKFLNKVTTFFNTYYPGLTSSQKDRILCKVYAANFKVGGDEEEIKERILLFLPLNLCNLKYIIAKNNFLYEPNNAATYNSAVYLMKKFSTFDASADKRRNYLRLMIINMCRSLSSIFALFELGDDVHALSLVRGFIEQEIKLCILLRDREAFDDFILFNEYSQNMKQGFINEKMKSLFQAARVYSRNEKESFLLYGWSSTKYKVMSFRRLLEMYSKDDANKIYEIFSECSEFVHEDYIASFYDYEALRKKYSIYLTLIFFKFIYPLVEATFNHDFLTIEGMKVKDMVDLDSLKQEFKDQIPIGKFYRRI